MTPPGTVSVADLAKITDYLNNGGNLYMESVNIGTDNFGTPLMNYFGSKLDGDGEAEEVETITAAAETFADHLDYEYAGGDEPHYSVDRLIATDAEPLYTSEDGYERVLLNDAGSYKVISSSIIMSAFKDGDSLSIKPYLMAEMINYFLGVNTVTDIRDAFNKPVSFRSESYPNPFVDHTDITFDLPETTKVKLEILDQSGRMVYSGETRQFSRGHHHITWNAGSCDGTAASGIYFYRLHAGNRISSGKLILNR